MKIFSNIRLYAWIEFVIWLLIVAAVVLGIRYNHYQHQQQFKSYQIFMDDVDGLIVGSPVRFLGVQIGHVKKIQILKNSSDVYIRFIITQEKLELPIGAIATVESYGLGGSKSLEIYPPDKSIVTEKIIVSKSPTRLSTVMGLFDNIFKELDSIIATLTHASEQFDFTSGESIPKNIIVPVEAGAKLDDINKAIDSAMNFRNNLMNNINKEKTE